MPELTVCPSCEGLVFVGTCTCPHCGADKACRGSGLSKAALLMGISLSLTGCVGEVSQPDYGVAITDSARDTGHDTGGPDADGDGWEAPTDCDDTDPSVHPEATETVGDKVDSNCDGNDDT